jgi:hypothetical protein
MDTNSARIVREQPGVIRAGMPCICELSRLRSAGITLHYCVYRVLPTPSGSATGCYRSRAGVYIRLLQGGGGRPGYYGYSSYVPLDRHLGVC